MGKIIERIRERRLHPAVRSISTLYDPPKFKLSARLTLRQKPPYPYVWRDHAVCVDVTEPTGKIDRESMPYWASSTKVVESSKNHA